MRDWLLAACKDLAQITGVIAAVAIPVALLLAHVHTQYEIARSGYEVARVTREHRQLTEDYRKLQIEAAVEGRTARLTEAGKARFGLTHVSPEQVTSLHMPTPDAPARAETSGAPQQEHAALTLR